MNDVGLLGQDHSGETHSGAPQVTDGSPLPEAEQPENEKHRKEEEPDFVDGIAAVENEARRDGHGERGDPADIAADEWLEFQRQMNRKNAGQHDRQPDRPDIPPQQSLANKENIEVERPVIIRRVISVEPVLDHLIDEPAVDSLVEMRGLDPEEEKPEERPEPNDYPRRPIDLAASRDPLVHPPADRGRRNQWRGLGDAATSLSDAHIGDRWLWLHREQLYSVYFATLQAGFGEQCRCPHLCRKPREPGRNRRGTWRAL